jgi:dephospho-CoA kinase
MRVVGLTGAPGSGKSTVAAMLAGKGYPVLDADRVAHDLYTPGSSVVEALVQAFGAGVRNADGGIDRTALGARVFGHPDRLSTLNAIVHPPLLRELERRIEEARTRGVPVLILEAALLLQWGPPGFVDRVVGVLAPESARRARLRAKGLEAAQTERRMASHGGPAADDPRLDRVIVNDGTLDELTLRVEELARVIGPPGAGGRRDDKDPKGR